MQFRHPWGGLAVPDAPAPRVSILGLPYDGAACFRKGAALGPDALRAISNSSPAIGEEGYEVEGLPVEDLGNVVSPREPGEAPRAAYFEAVETSALRALQKTFLFSLGGDHSVTIPLVRAFARRHPEGFGLVHLDAHPDLFDTYEGSKTSHACPMRRALETGCLRPEHLLILGTRSYNSVELAFMREHGIRFIPAREFHRMGPEAVVSAARQHLGSVESVYLTLDIDVVDPAYAPGTGAPVAGGLTSRELLDLVRGLVETLPIKAMDMVEIAPDLDPTGATLFLGLQVVFETFAALARSGGGA